MQINEFQRMMYDLYFCRDSKRGIKGTYQWLLDEMEELWEAIERGDKKEIEKEFADVIAWLASLSNLTMIDLEKAAIEKYNYQCPKCKHSPCQCEF